MALAENGHRRERRRLGWKNLPEGPHAVFCSAKTRRGTSLRVPASQRCGNPGGGRAVPALAAMRSGTVGGDACELPNRRAHRGPRLWTVRSRDAAAASLLRRHACGDFCQRFEVKHYAGWDPPRSRVLIKASPCPTPRLKLRTLVARRRRPPRRHGHIRRRLAGNRRVQPHQLVYGALKGQMGGVLHALALTTLAPD